MYHDDPYDPTLETNYITPAYAASVCSDNMTVNSRAVRNRQLADQYKNEDKGYCKVKREGHNGKLVDVELYSGSDTPGAKIRGAITGTKYGEYRVGTSDEYMFFKVGIITGEKGLRGNKTFFFDGPDQYEKHMRTTVDSATKNAWSERNIKEVLRRKKD